MSKNPQIENILLQTGATPGADTESLHGVLDRLETALADQHRGNVTNTASSTVKVDGWIVGLSVAALALTLYAAISTQMELHDLHAWKDLQTREILELQHNQPEKSK